MVLISHTSEATKWLMHALSPYDPLTPLQYVSNPLRRLPGPFLHLFYNINLHRIKKFQYMISLEGRQVCRLFRPSSSLCRIRNTSRHRLPRFRVQNGRVRRSK